MNTKLKMTMLAAGSALIGAMAALVVLFANAVPTYPRIVGMAPVDPSARVINAFPLGAPQDVSATSNGSTFIGAFPRGITRFEDGRSGFASVSLSQPGSWGGDIVGYGSVVDDLDDLSGESYVVLGNMTVHSMWTVEMPGRARAVCFDVQSAMNFPPTVVIPNYASGSVRDKSHNIVPMTRGGREGRY